ncbi:MAG: phosphate--acyl-ACP acyltransferase [Calditrichaeota bacterium]|nr:phosphate--acyl-ACP acyltransferase [Calditrichota bacterium]
MRIALDLFGGDNAPEATVEGAKIAVADASTPHLKRLTVTLVGSRNKLKGTLTSNLPDEIKFLDIKENDSSADDGPHAAGNDPASPIRTALRLHREGKFDAVVSAGTTGSQLIASLHELERIPGITRPAVGSFVPTMNGKSFILDIGASLTASPHHFVQFAAMGHVYVKEMLGIEEPSIGVLNVAREGNVGDSNAIIARQLLKESNFNFKGFVEGNDIPKGTVDIIITNGFVGNIILKYTEGFPAVLKQLLPDLSSSEMNSKIKKHLDYETFGGEPLLGVKGVSVICHGASTPRAIAAGILKAAEIARLKFHEKLDDFILTKFDSYLSQVKYLRSFRRSLRLPDRFKIFGQDDRLKN